jgi:hypothetical protein
MEIYCSLCYHTLREDTRRNELDITTLKRTFASFNSWSGIEMKMVRWPLWTSCTTLALKISMEEVGV